MAGASGPNLIDSGLVLALDVADSYNFNLTAVEVLVVAGGGSGGGYGGNDGAGGGGAGGLIYNSNFAVTPGSALTVTVGAGGAGVGGATPGNNGENSIFGSLTAIGGGGGGTEGAAGTREGRPGGSGGGAGGYGVKSGGAGTSGQGFKGGDCTAPGDGGGGGAGGEGSNGLTGNGGPGLGFNISGTFTHYAGGGGASGDRRNSRGSSGGTGGIGGGGNGQSADIGSSLPANYNGTANTGGGGGGAAGSNATHGAGTTYTSGAGGSGIVIVRYLGPQRAIGGTVSSVGGYTIHTFTTVGSTTFTPLAASNNSTILGLADLSNNNRFATTAGSPIYSNEKEGNIFFEGTDEYIEIPFETILNDCSIEVIFKATSTRLYQYLLSIGNGSNSSYSFYLDMNDPDSSGFAQTMWAYWNSGGTPYSVIPKTGTYGNWNDSTWRHYVFTRGSTTNHYMNGNIVQNVSRAGDQTIQFGNGSGYKLRIASYQTNALYFTGNVASVKIYNKELTASEIKQNYNTIKKRFVIDYGDIIRDGLVLHLDASSYSGSGSTWYDLSGQGNNGTINGATYDSSYGGTMVFDGSDSIDCGSPSNLSITVGTVCAWFKKPHGSGYKGLVDKGRDGYGAWSLNVDETANTATFKAHISGNSRLIVASSSYGNDIWTYVCGVYDGTNLLIYQNGTLSNSASYSGTIGTNSVSVRVGSANDGLYFNGNIAHASIYNRALSASEIQQNFNALRTRFGI
jgi:hypothetical protein